MRGAGSNNTRPKDLKARPSFARPAAFAILVGTYFVLHCKEPKRFYRNPLKRGFGPPRPAGAFGWLGVVARMPLDEVERHVGSDGRALLEFISLGLRIMSSYAAFGVLALVTYVATSQIASSQPDCTPPAPLATGSPAERTCTARLFRGRPRLPGEREPARQPGARPAPRQRLARFLAVRGYLVQRAL